MDRRYRENYKISIKENLEYIKENGVKKLVVEQYVEHQCSKCGDLISVHNKKCFKCDKITKLVEKIGLPEGNT